MMGVTRGYSAPLRKLDCQIAGGGDPPTMRMRMRNALAMTTAAFGLAGLSACSPVPNNLPPAPATPDPGAGYSSNLQPYRIQVGDVLAVRLMLNPELNEEVTVRPDGHISTTVARRTDAWSRCNGDPDLCRRRGNHPGRVHHTGTHTYTVSGDRACGRL